MNVKHLLDTYANVMQCKRQLVGSFDDPFYNNICNQYNIWTQPKTIYLQCTPQIQKSVGSGQS